MRMAKLFNIMNAFTCFGLPCNGASFMLNGQWVVGG